MAKFLKTLKLTLVSLLVLMVSGSPKALASFDQPTIYEQLNWYWYRAGGVNLTLCSTTLVGNSREDQIWNFFKGKGLSDQQVAGIMGNIEQESNFDPERLQKGGDSQNPADADSGPNGETGWGLIQWSPGSKVIGLAKQAGVTGPIYELATQLELIWQHMNNHPDVTGHFDLNYYKTLTDEKAAAIYFRIQIEGGSDPNGIRETYATQILNQYAGKAPPSGSSTTNCGIGQQTDCTTVSGDPKILCEAEKYQGIYYRWGGGHQGYSAFIAGCPDPSNPPNNQPTGSPPDPTDHNESGNPSPCATDCSSLVSIAVDAAFNQTYMWSVTGGVMQGGGADSWHSIPIGNAGPGDIVTSSEHVEIVDHVAGTTVYTFGSHQTGTQTGQAASSTSDWLGAWHWTGPGGS